MFNIITAETDFYAKARTEHICNKVMIDKSIKTGIFSRKMSPQSRCCCKQHTIYSQTMIKSSMTKWQESVKSKGEIAQGSNEKTAMIRCKEHQNPDEQCKD